LVLGTGLVWWWRRHRFRPLALLAAAYLGARVVETSVKVLTHRPRPPAAEAVAEFTRFAFPSGHAVYALAVYGMLALLVIRRWEKGRMPVIIAATVLVGLIGISRVYLGAHWLTDTLGGFILGGLWLSSLVFLIRAADELKDADRLARPTGRRANEDGDAKTPRRERENEQERF
jgi:membrane-associated phospholipid phosphatase